MSEDAKKDFALEQARKCPVCEGSKVESPPENYIVLGLVTRDIVPMDKLAAIICDRHTALILYYYDIMVALSVAYNGNVEPIDVPSLTPAKDTKDMN